MNSVNNIMNDIEDVYIIINGVLFNICCVLIKLLFSSKKWKLRFFGASKIVDIINSRINVGREKLFIVFKGKIRKFIKVLKLLLSVFGLFSVFLLFLLFMIWNDDVDLLYVIFFDSLLFGSRFFSKSFTTFLTFFFIFNIFIYSVYGNIVLI